jgi:hypothetical protein
MDRYDKDKQLLLAIANGQTIGNAAASAGYSRRTAHRRLVSPEFQRRLNELRQGQVDAAVEELTEAAPKAVRTIIDLMDCVQPNIRLQAAKLILDMTVNTRRHDAPAQDQTTEQAPKHDWGKLITQLAAGGYFEDVEEFPPVFQEFQALSVKVETDPSCRQELRTAEFKLMHLFQLTMERYPEREMVIVTQGSRPHLELPPASQDLQEIVKGESV